MKYSRNLSVYKKGKIYLVPSGIYLSYVFDGKELLHDGRVYLKGRCLVLEEFRHVLSIGQISAVMVMHSDGGIFIISKYEFFGCAEEMLENQ